MLVDLSPLHERLLAVAGDLSYRRLADMTAHNPETVRRYMQGHSPSVEFLSAICRQLDVSGEWLLTGRGAKQASKAREHALREANPSELLGAMAATVERLAERVDRLEAFLMTLDTRVRVMGNEANHEPNGSNVHALGLPRPARPTDRAEFVADALAQRPREDDRAGAAPRHG